MILLCVMFCVLNGTVLFVFIVGIPLIFTLFGVRAGKFGDAQCAQESTCFGDSQNDYQAAGRSGDGIPYFQGS